MCSLKATLQLLAVTHGQSSHPFYLNPWISSFLNMFVLYFLTMWTSSSSVSSSLLHQKLWQFYRYLIPVIYPQAEQAENRQVNWFLIKWISLLKSRYKRRMIGVCIISALLDPFSKNQPVEKLIAFHCDSRQLWDARNFSPNKTRSLIHQSALHFMQLITACEFSFYSYRLNKIQGHHMDHMG